MLNENFYFNLKFNNSVTTLEHPLHSPNLAPLPMLSIFSRLITSLKGEQLADADVVKLNATKQLKELSPNELQSIVNR